MSLSIRAVNSNLEKINPYKSVENANFKDLQYLVNKACKKTGTPVFLPEDKLSMNFFSIFGELLFPQKDFIDILRSGDKSVKNLGDLYLTFKNRLIMEKAEKIGDALHTRTVHTFAGIKD